MISGPDAVVIGGGIVGVCTALQLQRTGRRVTVTNRGPDAATMHLLPTVWYRNTWSWGCTHEGCWPKPRIERAAGDTVLGRHASLGTTLFAYEAATISPARQSPDSGQRRSAATSAGSVPSMIEPATQMPCRSSPARTTATAEPESA